jgi:hypothetical protein
MEYSILSLSLYVSMSLSLCADPTTCDNELQISGRAAFGPPIR